MTDQVSDQRDIYRQQGFGERSGIGRKPMLLVVDFVVSFADPAIFGGGNIAEAIAATSRLLTYARAQRWPIAMTRMVFSSDGSDANVFTRKVPGLLALTENDPKGQIVPELAPIQGELVVRKRLPSAFAGTDLASWSTGRGVDTVIVAGATTSGCVRASVVDSMSNGFLTLVASDGVGDRALPSHQASLFDLGQKYADLMTVGEIISFFDVIAEGLSHGGFSRI